MSFEGAFNSPGLHANPQVRRSPGPQSEGEDPYAYIYIKFFSEPQEHGLETEEDLRRWRTYWYRQVAYWQERWPYDSQGVIWTRGGVLVDGDTYVSLKEDSYLWVWDEEEKWIGGFINPGRIQMWKRAQMLVGDDFPEQWLGEE